MMILIMWLSVAMPIFSLDFNDIRSNNIQSLIVPSFTATMDSSDAKILLQNKIKGQYKVEVSFNMVRGVTLLVHSDEEFHQNLLYQQEVFINKMLLPFLNSVAYQRIKDRMVSKIIKDNIYQVEYKIGDSNIRYEIETNKIGLVNKIIYFSDKTKEYMMIINWQKIGDKYAPNQVKTTSYKPTIQLMNFKLTNIVVK